MPTREWALFYVFLIKTFSKDKRFIAVINGQSLREKR